MRCLALIVLLITCGTSSADSPAPPTPRVMVSASGRYFFSILPPHWNDKGQITRQPLGTAYELQDNGSFRTLWRVTGWYAFQCFLSDDGRYLVRMGDWAFGHEPSKEDLAVAFYDRGKLLREYSTAELVKDKTKVVTTVSHYFWLASEAARFGPGRDEKHYEPPPTLDDDKFLLKTCDGIEYRFDVTTGKIEQTKGA
jgi:hypothetical protein